MAGLWASSGEHAAIPVLLATARTAQRLARVAALLCLGLAEVRSIAAQTADPPAFGWQRCQILANGETVVHTTSETFLARKGEDREGFLRRLALEHGVGPGDSVEITFKAGGGRRRTGRVWPA